MCIDGEGHCVAIRKDSLYPCGRLVCIDEEARCIWIRPVSDRVLMSKACVY